jgi:hypothetical protein
LMRWYQKWFLKNKKIYYFDIFLSEKQPQPYSQTGSNGVLNQECHPAAYFSERLNEAKQKYSTYDNKFYLHQHPSHRQVVVMVEFQK